MRGGEGGGEVALSAHGSMHAQDKATTHKLVRINWKLMLWISPHEL